MLCIAGQALVRDFKHIFPLFPKAPQIISPITHESKSMLEQVQEKLEQVQEKSLCD